MATTCADIQSLIDAKVALIGQLITTITTITASPRPSYNIDGQQVDFNSYMKNLTEMQVSEVACLKSLYELQNIICPYQFQSTAIGGNFWGGW